HRSNSGTQVLMIARRGLEANRRKSAELGLTFPIVLQRHWEISLLYAKFATPIAYLIDEHGALASDVAAGVRPTPAFPALAAKQQAQTAERNGASAEEGAAGNGADRGMPARALA